MKRDFIFLLQLLAVCDMVSEVRSARTHLHIMRGED